MASLQTYMVYFTLIGAIVNLLLWNNILQGGGKTITVSIRNKNVIESWLLSVGETIQLKLCNSVLLNVYYTGTLYSSTPVPNVLEDKSLPLVACSTGQL